MQYNSEWLEHGCIPFIMDTTIPEKVLRYESFVNDVLKEDLQKVHHKREQFNSEMAEYLQLKNSIQSIMDLELIDGFKTKMNLGCDFYVQANIPDASKILINIGLGYYVEFTLPEALQFIEKRLEWLILQSDKLKKDSAQTKGMIKLVLGGLHELQKGNLSNNTVGR